MRLVIDTTQLKGLARHIEKAEKLIGSVELMDELAGLAEAQTKRRIADEKTDPRGFPWKPWDPAYAKTRKAHHSLLIDSGNLRDDIAGQAVDGRLFEVFTVRVYGGAQNAKREFLGLSQANARELETLTLDMIRGEL